MEIKSCLSGSVLFSFETDSMKICLEAAVKAGVDLTCVDLAFANLAFANLTGANLTRANLTFADLAFANLTGANLTRANLTRADLTCVDLAFANLAFADLTGANLTFADLAFADLTRANLIIIRDDFFAVLSSAPAEVDALIIAIKNGRIDGSTYNGNCACLVGTIANARKCGIDNLGILKPQSSRPAERFFLGINIGDTPETNQFSKLALEWAELWLSSMKATLGNAA